LSLLDQAIAYGAGAVRASEVRAMLGTIERGQVFALLQAVHAGDGARLIGEVERIAEFSPDFAGVLDEVAGALHRIQLKQIVDAQATEQRSDEAQVTALASSMAPEEVQLFYQIAVTGRRDLPIAPTPRSGFEMTLLRMLAFRPVNESARTETGDGRTDSKIASPPVREAATREQSDQPAALISVASPPVDASNWSALIEAAGLRGPIGQLAQHSALIAIDDGVVRLALKPGHADLIAPPQIAQLE